MRGQAECPRLPERLTSLRPWLLRGPRHASAATLVAWVVLATTFPVSAARLVSIDFTGTESANGHADHPALATSGRAVAFASPATDLVPEEALGRSNIFARDLAFHHTVLVSVNDEPVRGFAGSPTISSNGRRVAYVRSLTNIVFSSEVLLRDLDEPAAKLITADADGLPVGGSQPLLSSDGEWLAFQSGSGAFDPRDTNSTADVYLYEVATGTYRLVSVNRFGTASGNGFSDGASLSADGRFVVFTSDAEDLVVNDGNGHRDVFLRDMLTGVTRLVSRSLTGGGANRPSGAASISADGRFVLFNSTATNLSPLDGNDTVDAYRFAVADSTVELVSLAADGMRAANCHSVGGAISPNGQLALLESCASDLVNTPAVPFFRDHVYLHDMAAGVTELISVRGDGAAPGNDESSLACVASGCRGAHTFSANGRFVVFTSWASDLSTDPVVNICELAPCQQVYVRDRHLGVTRLVSLATDGLSSGSLPSDSPMISSSGAVITFASEAPNLDAVDSNGLEDVFVDGALEIDLVEVPGPGPAGLFLLTVILGALAWHLARR